MRLIGAMLLAVATPVAAEEFVTLKGHGGPIMGLAVSETGVVRASSRAPIRRIYSAGVASPAGCFFAFTSSSQIEWC